MARYLKAEAVADKLNISRAKLYELLKEWVADGIVRRVKIGACWHYFESDIDAYMAKLAQSEAA